MFDFSIAKELRPDQIIFHYIDIPQEDPKGYFTWFSDVRREVAMLGLKKLSDKTLCGHNFSKGQLIVFESQ